MVTIHIARDLVEIGRSNALKRVADDGEGFSVRDSLKLILLIVQNMQKRAGAAVMRGVIKGIRRMVHPDRFLDTGGGHLRIADIEEA